MRVIYSSEIVREPEREEIAYVVRGQSFLRYMVRKIVGTLIEVGKGRLTPEDIPRIFELRDRSQSGPTMPPEGLYLVSLEHPDPTDSLASEKTSRTARKQRKLKGYRAEDLWRGERWIHPCPPDRSPCSLCLALVFFPRLLLIRSVLSASQR